MKQPQYTPYNVENQVVLIYAATNGYIDSVPEQDARRYEAELMDYLSQKHATLMKKIVDEKAIKDDTKASLNSALTEFKAIFRPTEKA